MSLLPCHVTFITKFCNLGHKVPFDTYSLDIITGRQKAVSRNFLLYEVTLKATKRSSLSLYTLLSWQSVCLKICQNWYHKFTFVCAGLLGRLGKNSCSFRQNCANRKSTEHQNGSNGTKTNSWRTRRLLFCGQWCGVFEESQVLQGTGFFHWGETNFGYSWITSPKSQISRGTSQQCTQKL